MTPTDRIKAALIETLRNQGVSLAPEQPPNGIAFVGDGNGHTATVVLPHYADEMSDDEMLVAIRRMVAYSRAMLAMGRQTKEQVMELIQAVKVKSFSESIANQLVSSPEIASIASRYMTHEDENVRALAASVLAQAEVV